MLSVLSNGVAARPGRVFYGLAAIETLVIAALFGLQFRMALPSEEARWPLSILSLINLVAAGGLALFAGLRHEGKGGARNLLLALGVLFIASPLLEITLPDTGADVDDWTVFASWLLSFPMLIIILSREKTSAAVQPLFLTGILLQGAAILGDAGLDDGFAFPESGIDIMDWTYVTGSTLSVLAYLLGFQLLAAGTARQAAFERLGLDLHEGRRSGSDVINVQPERSDWSMANAIHAEFASQPHSQFIASPFTLGYLAAVLRVRRPRSVLEVGAGIGTITKLLLTHPVNIQRIVSTENHPICLGALEANLPPQPQGRWTLMASLDQVSGRVRTYDLVIYDGDIGEDHCSVFGQGTICFVEGDRLGTRETLRAYLRRMGCDIQFTDYRPGWEIGFGKPRRIFNIPMRLIRIRRGKGCHIGQVRLLSAY